MPIDQEKIPLIRAQLEKAARGEKAMPIDIGTLTEKQFADLNAGKVAAGLPVVESAAVVYIGKHHYQSRTKDGYTIDDMIAQLVSAFSEASIVASNKYMTTLTNPATRDDGYGNLVNDQAVLECTVRRPKSEAYSAIPKGDKSSPKKQKPLR